jgi:hypothetical protein
MPRALGSYRKYHPNEDQQAILDELPGRHATYYHQGAANRDVDALTEPGLYIIEQASYIDADQGKRWGYHLKYRDGTVVISAARRFSPKTLAMLAVSLYRSATRGNGRNEVRGNPEVYCPSCRRGSEESDWIQEEWRTYGRQRTRPQCPHCGWRGEPVENLPSIMRRSSMRRNPPEDSYTISRFDIGRPTIRAFGKVWLTQNFIGRILPRDVGKKVCLRGDILQVENDEQFNRRSAATGLSRFNDTRHRY